MSDDYFDNLNVEQLRAIKGGLMRAVLGIEQEIRNKLGIKPDQLSTEAHASPELGLVCTLVITSLGKGHGSDVTVGTEVVDGSSSSATSAPKPERSRKRSKTK